MLPTLIVGSHNHTDQPTYPSGTHTCVENTTPLAVLPTKHSPFSSAILMESLPVGVKITNFSKYNGTGDTQEHLYWFYAKADLYDLSDVAHCKIFRTTLTKRALSYFEQLTQHFLHQFSINKKYPKTAAYLFLITQKEGESHPGIMQQNLRHGRFKESIVGKPPVMLKELLQRAEKRKKDERRPHSLNAYTRFALLNVRLSEVLMVAEQHGLIHPPHPLRESSKRANSDKYCCFHQDRRHTTKDHFHLKQKIERLIRKGYLTEFRRRREFANSWGDSNHSGGPASGDLSNAKRALLCATSRVNSYTPSSHPSEQVYQLQTSTEELTFGESDLEGRWEQHNDALVISATFSNFWVQKILVDSGSFANIIFYDVFLKLGIDNAQLNPVNTPLIGFGHKVVEALGEVALPFSLGSYPKRVKKMVKFLVVNAPSTYNIILGKPSLNLFHAIASTYHIKVNFSTSEGISEAIGDQWMAQKCYTNTL
ncbi:hypothetical protein Pfo_016239 [Paulownia fortunei]|nr:hypothetical protein Pfo_016239 [Paulownia fortunei]